MQDTLLSQYCYQQCLNVSAFAGHSSPPAGSFWRGRVVLVHPQCPAHSLKYQASLQPPTPHAEAPTVNEQKGSVQVGTGPEALRPPAAQDSRFGDCHTQSHWLRPQAHGSLALAQSSLLFQLIRELHKTIAPAENKSTYPV